MRAKRIAATMLQTTVEELPEGLIAHLEVIDQTVKNAGGRGLRSRQVIAFVVSSHQLGLAQFVQDIDQRLSELEARV